MSHVPGLLLAGLGCQLQDDAFGFQKHGMENGGRRNWPLSLSLSLHCGNGSLRRFYLKKTEKENPAHVHTHSPGFPSSPRKHQIVPSPLHQTIAELNIARTIKPNAAMVHRWQKSDVVTQGDLVAQGELIAVANKVWEP